MPRVPRPLVVLLLELVLLLIEPDVVSDVVLLVDIEPLVVSVVLVLPLFVVRRRLPRRPRPVPVPLMLPVVLLPVELPMLLIVELVPEVPVVCV